MAAPEPAATASAAAATAPPPGQRPIFVLNSLDASVSVLDPVTFTERERIPVGKEPHHLYLTPDDKSLLVANALSDSLTFIDPLTAKVQRTLGGISDPYQLRFSPDMKWFVTLANRLNHVDIYKWQPENAAEPMKLVKRVSTGKTPSHQWIDSKSTTVYATMQDSDELVAIDLATQAVRWRVPTGKLPADVYLTADDKTLFVGLTGDRFVEVYDVSNGPAKLVKRIQTGEGAHAFRAMGDKRHIFVSNRVANTISLIDTQTMTVVSELPGPGGPDCLDLMADGRTLLVSSRWARKVSVVDIIDKKVVRQIPVGRSPHGVWTLDHVPRQ
ncbi:MAG TPA: YncE family protein [Ideonella sp.]|uniref:YncE family protein n=1 Tax=Ideonella sp. TaxID=1929293 RepID=UPI002D0DAEC0|nr:YncE family protein [Ideonella sp.]HSI47920.1 YncE family protein [Ideonella sp.]